MDKDLVNILNRDEIDTVLAFAEYDMGIRKTARETFFHYNTIVYRLERVKEKTGLDPHRFYDLMKLVQMLGK